LKFIRNITAISALLLWSFASFAQPSTDQQLAAHYFQNEEFDKAALYYEKLYSKSQSEFFFNYYIRCLVQLKDYKTAEKVSKKQLKKFPYELKYYVSLGNVYKQAADESKAKQQFEKAIKELGPDYQQVNSLAAAFNNINELDFALATYQKGQKMLKGSYPFNLQIAQLYGAKGEVNKMIVEYLNLLGDNSGYVQSVQNSLGRAMDFESGDDKKVDVLRVELLKRVQKQPGKTIYSEMLIWLFQQKKDFNSAFIHVKALDKREKSDGKRVLALADLCHSNEEYTIAVKAYEYVIGLGSTGYYYSRAKMELLNTLNQKVTTSSYTRSDIESLEKRYNETLTEIGKYAGSVSLMKELAHLKAFYLHNIDAAATLLEEAINMPGTPKKLQAECKLELGDILLLQGEIWDASLYYSQVDKAFKHDILGHEAKFRNARISYFVGNFEWAQSQLDVLKSSTSKLIANDAMDLSLLITDNLALDTIRDPMLMYARADLLLFQNKYDQALAALDSLNGKFPWHALNDEVLYQRFKIAKKRGNMDDAVSNLQKIVVAHGDDILADDALFNLGDIYQYHYKDLTKAQEYYEQLLFKYTGSLYTVEARKRYRKLRGDDI
jgi:tetratricopeptide (TPR) repeat protein